MTLLTLAKEIAALAGYSVTGTDTQSVADKARALRRVNQVRADIVSRFAGRWSGQYREGWLPLVAVYGTGTVAVTGGLRTVTGSGTTWTSAMVGRKFLGPDSAYYKIANVSSSTSLTLTQPYQSADVASGGSYQIWKDEYVLYPDVYSVLDFVNYIEPSQMVEDTVKHSRFLNPRSTANLTPDYFSVLGRKRVSGSYSTGTVSMSINTQTLTGSGTSWLANIDPGFAITIGSYTYHVDTVDSDTQITILEYAVAAVTAGTSYTALGQNALVVRFSAPSSQTIVSYGYYAKSYPLINDSDEDWIAEMYPHVIISGATRYDYIDKKDPIRAQLAAQAYQDDIHNAHQAETGMYGGTSLVGLDIPTSARE